MKMKWLNLVLALVLVAGGIVGAAIDGIPVVWSVMLLGEGFLACTFFNDFAQGLTEDPNEHA